MGVYGASSRRCGRMKLTPAAGSRSIGTADATHANPRLSINRCLAQAKMNGKLQVRELHSDQPTRVMTTAHSCIRKSYLREVAFTLAAASTEGLDGERTCTGEKPRDVTPKDGEREEERETTAAQDELSILSYFLSASNDNAGFTA